MWQVLDFLYVYKESSDRVPPCGLNEAYALAWGILAKNDTPLKIVARVYVSRRRICTSMTNQTHGRLMKRHARYLDHVSSTYYTYWCQKKILIANKSGSLAAM